MAALNMLPSEGLDMMGFQGEGSEKGGGASSIV